MCYQGQWPRVKTNLNLTKCLSCFAKENEKMERPKNMYGNLFWECLCFFLRFSKHDETMVSNGRYWHAALRPVLCTSIWEKAHWKRLVKIRNRQSKTACDYRWSFFFFTRKGCETFVSCYSYTLRVMQTVWNPALCHQRFLFEISPVVLLTVMSVTILSVCPERVLADLILRLICWNCCLRSFVIRKLFVNLALSDRIFCFDSLLS